MTTKDLFIVITWPEVQDIMDLEGFWDNALLINEEPFFSLYGSSAYMVNFEWLNEGAYEIEIKERRTL